MVETQHHHRSTLKQTNKHFKSKHTTKSSLRDAAKGRISRSPRKASPALSGAAQTRLNRRNNAKQVQNKKRAALASATRVFNGVDGAPRIVAVIPLSEDINPQDIAKYLAEGVDSRIEGDPADNGLWKLKVDRFKASLQIINVPYRKFFAALDACKVADYVVFALSTTVEVDKWGDTLLRTLQAQGLPDVVTVASPNAQLELKERSGVVKSLLSFIQYFVPSQTRVFDLHVASDLLNAVRCLTESKPSDVRWREGRSWILGEATEWSEGTLKVTGIVRGAPLSANRLIHIPNFGDFQISKVISAPLPRHSKSGHTASMEVESNLLVEPNAEEADSLVSSNDPDDLANEQTWPTEDEMNGTHDVSEPSVPDAQKGTTPKAVKRIPKGMSAYQAAWIIDETDEDDDDDNELGGYGDGNGGKIQEDRQEEEMQDMPVDDEVESEKQEVAFPDLDVEEEERQLDSWRNRKREEEDDLHFPDEIDTPKDKPARVRFQRYRGMKSFRTSPWDPFENLPRDYARIFQFEDFKRAERGVRRRAEDELNAVEPGTRISVFLKDVPSEAGAAGPITLFALLQHEHKISVLNFAVQRNTEYDGSVRSKDPLLLCVGPRRLQINPVYSQHTRGGGKGANNVHKFERYLRHGLTSIATTYGPVIFGHQPCMFLRERSDVEAPELVSMGTFLNPDTTRIVAKRIILTGHPFKVHKKTATVRYMFFNSDDIQYFKPIQIHTKHGRIGHIRESLGTHGYFKAHFDGPITQMDTVCMSLYKRVYPKWARLWSEGTSRKHDPSEDAMEE